jgi:hypothetical protein
MQQQTSLNLTIASCTNFSKSKIVRSNNYIELKSTPISYTCPLIVSIPLVISKHSWLNEFLKITYISLEEQM